MKQRKFLILMTSLVRYLLIFLFTYTGVSKIIDHDHFYTSIMLSPVLREQASIVVWLVPVVELLIVVLLFFKRFLQAGLVCSLMLMISFTLYITYMIFFMEQLPCSCGGIIQELSWSNHLFFNSIFILLITITLLHTNQHKLFIAINRTSRKPV